jgi:hypothetical protein
VGENYFLRTVNFSVIGTTNRIENQCCEIHDPCGFHSFCFFSSLFGKYRMALAVIVLFMWLTKIVEQLE